MKRIIKVNAEVRYPEDAKVNCVEESNDNPTMPFLNLCKFEKKNWSGKGTYIAEEWHWQFEIDAVTGIIKDWPSGINAVSYYKVCDCCELEYYEDDKFICNNDGEYYVPSFLCLDDEGYGDYMDLTIDENGQIQNWSIKKVDEWIKRHIEN